MVTRARLALGATAIVAIGILAIAPACGSGFLDGLSGGARDAGVDTAQPPIDTGVDARACTLSRVPLPPPPETESNFPGSVILAIDALRIDNSGNAPGIIPPSIGVDLDDACTCPEPESCIPPPDAGIKKCDGDGGADNALGAMFGTLANLDPKAFGPDFATNRIRVGSYGAMMAIADWNREPNDAKVFVSFYLSQGAAAAVDAGNNTAIKMDGTDVWTVDPESIRDGESKIGVDCGAEPANCIPQYVTQGYVVDNTVVARINAPIALSASTGRITIEMNDVAIIARLRKDGELYRAEGEFVGRWPVTKVLRTLGEIPIEDKPLCEQPLYFELARSEVCAGADIASMQANDHKAARCDAVSSTLRFQGGTAKLGRIFRPSLPTPACQGFMPTCP